MTKLLIVESPAKAKTIGKYLGKEFRVAASVGHVVDLPKKDLGVDLEHDFKPKYEVMPEKKKQVSALKSAAEGVSEIFLAPDPDREGEAIAWHIADLLKKTGKPMHRVLINEITKPAVLSAIAAAGELNHDRFNAQQARRILDRLVGYLISPLISKKFRSNLSAGRVQSVALRMVVDRERAIRAFKPQEYWSIAAQLAAKLPPEFLARLVAIKEKTLDLPERFDKDTNKYVPIDLKKNCFVPNEDAAKKISQDIAGKPFVVSKVERQERRRNPSPPFITSTLQQEAARKLSFPAKKTMQLAQKLYEGLEVGEGAVGLITYMRTDSPRVSDQAMAMVREYIQNFYGPEFLWPQPRVYKSRKTAQEAHEAIRPTAMERTPEQVKPYLDRDLYRLYELIFLRFVASQMKPAVYDQTTIEIPVGDYLFRANGRVIKFKGFLAVYEESTEEEAESPEDFPLPPLAAGDALAVKGILPEQHFTKPPPRFTEASLVKELEERGIGRPSTYAQILSTIQDRKYVSKEQARFFAAPLGERLTDILVATFPDILDVSFTAQMEEDLDKVEEGHENWVQLLHRFYGPFEKRLAAAGAIMDAQRQDQPTDLPCPTCGKELTIKWGKQGEFLACSGYPECSFTSNFRRDDKGEIVIQANDEGKSTGIVCERCGKPMVIKKTRQGGREFLACSGYPECKNASDFARGENGEIKPVARAQAEATGIVCDKCGKPMVIKRAAKTGREFLACSGYPKCKNATDFTRGEKGEIKPQARASTETGIACEKCGKPMVVKRAGKTGREFLACSGYPKCKNAKDFVRADDGKIKVVAVGEQGQVCDKCGKPMVLKRGKGGSFWGCSGYPECKNIVSLGEPAAPPAGPARKGSPPASAPDEPPCEKCGKPMVIKNGRFGPFIACSGYPACKNIRKKKAGAGAPAKKAGHDQNDPASDG